MRFKPVAPQRHLELLYLFGQWPKHSMSKVFNTLKPFTPVFLLVTAFNNPQNSLGYRNPITYTLTFIDILNSY